MDSTVQVGQTKEEDIPGPRTSQSRYIRGRRWDDPAPPAAPPREEKPTTERSVTE